MDRWSSWLLLALIGCSGGDADDDSVTDTDGPTDTDTDTDVPTTDTSIPSGDCATVTEVSVDLGGALLTRALTVTLDQPSEVWAACSDDADPSRVLLAESDGASDSHDLLVAGLYESSSWTCEVAATCSGATAETTTFTTNALPAPVDRGTVTAHVAGEPSGQFTLFNTGGACIGGGSQYLQIVDLDGRVRWGHDVGTGWELDIDASWVGDRIHYGGGWGLFDEGEPHRGVMRQVDLRGNVLLERTQTAFGLGYNHHSEVMPDGEILSLTTHDDTDGSTTWQGVGVERIDPATGDLTWSWSSQQLFDDGTLGTNSGNPYHNNSVEWITDSEGDALWISLYIGQEMWRIDRNTGQRTHVFGAGGDLQFLDPTGAPLPQSKWVYGQHDPDHAGDGRVVLYDNGVGRPGGDSSRVAEFDLDLAAGTATLLWEWTESPWYTPIIGDADYLDGDHVLVTKGVVNCLTFWIDQQSGLIELDKTTDEVVWRYDMDDDGTAIYRSQRYDGCEIFSDAAACPEVADRVATLRGLLAR